ncbi:MAG TPA: hypothetical protein VFQ54_05225 [Thermomicrobiales bacterium]|nr:hypothetical protein [Thermomicrobiales bacterium]
MEHVAFDPSRYLTKVKGNDYLEVKWRLVWLRDQYPDAVIETDLISHVGNQAIFRAKVTLPSGASSTGWGSEEISGFVNYVEKAETKAIGRALAALGFGTQFCPDFDYGADAGQVVDAPVDRQSFQQPTALFVSREETQDHAPSPKQAGFIQAISRELRMNAQGLNEFTQRLVGKDADQLSRRDASAVIEALKEQQQTRSSQRAS